MRIRQRKELKILLAASANSGIVGAVENAQVALGVDEYDCLSPALNCLHEIKLQVVSLACARSTRYQHVAFEIADREEDRRFLTTANGMKGRYAARVARLPLGSDQRLTVAFRRNYLVRVLRVPGKSVPHVLHLVLVREPRQF